MVADRLLATALLRGLLGAHLIAALVAGIAISVEAGDAAALGAILARRLPPTLVTVSPATTLLGIVAAVAGLRRRGVLLGLGSLGVAPTRVLWLAGGLGCLAGGLTLVPGSDRPPTAWERHEGGWVRGALAVPDAPDGRVGPAAAAPSPVGARVATSAASAALGAALGLAGGGVAAVAAASVLVLADLVGTGLDERGVVPGGRFGAAAAGATLLVGCRLRAPLFPRRWG